MEKEIRLIRVYIDKFNDETHDIDVFTNESGMIYSSVVDGNLTILRNNLKIAYYPEGCWLRLYINYNE